MTIQTIRAVEVAAPDFEKLASVAEEQYEVLKGLVKKSNGIVMQPGKYVKGRNAYVGKTDYRLDAEAWQGLLEGFDYKGPKNDIRGLTRESFNYKEVPGYTIYVKFDPRARTVSVSPSPKR